MNAKIMSKAIQWIGSHDTGLSSKTIWNALMGTEKFAIDVPWDAGDFGRCYRLLGSIPEWKTRLNELKTLSSSWELLIIHWDQLTELYEKVIASKEPTEARAEFSTLLRSCIN